MICITETLCVYSAVRTGYLNIILVILVHNEELQDLYSSPSIVRVMKSIRMRWGACNTVGEGRGMYRVLVGKPEGKRPLGRPRHRWEDNIKMDL
jgi:hypothetical protein